MTKSSSAQAPEQPPKPGPQHSRLDVFIGKHIGVDGASLTFDNHLG